jgi:hypothetical protein
MKRGRSLSGAQARDMAKSGTNTDHPMAKRDKPKPGSRIVALMQENTYNKLLFAAAFPLLHRLTRRSAGAAALPLVPAHCAGPPCVCVGRIARMTRVGFSGRRAGEGEGACE